MKLSLGFWLLYRTPLYDERRAGEVARLLTDPRWPWQPCFVRPMQRPGEALYDWPSGKTAASKLPGVIADVVRSERSQGIHLVASRADQSNHAWVVVDNGQPEVAHEGVAYPLSTRGMCRADVPAGRSLEAWLGVVRELASLVEAVQGVIWAGKDERPMIARQFLTGSHQPKMPPDHPHNESARINRVRNELGERYVRLPGWGTFLRSSHVEAVGGRARLQELVQPAVVEAVGPLLYVQLSPLADALAPETETRRRALAELLAPITVRPLS
jgi:hypothetical protein